MDEVKHSEQTQRVLYICSTYYHVYVTLMKQLTNTVCIDLVICDDIPSGEKLTQRLLSTDLFRNVWFVSQGKLPEVRGRNKLDWILFQHNRRSRIIKPLLPFDVDDYKDIYIFHDATPLGMYLMDVRKPYHLIEDSLNFYQRINETPQAKHRKPHSLKFKLRYFLNSGYFPLGDSRYVIDIEVNENDNLQVQGNTIIELPREFLQKSLSQESKKKILEVFGYPDLPPMDKHCALLLTEPLFADGICASIEEQLCIYKIIVIELNRKGFQTILKPHPRDTAVYSDIPAVILNKMFPVELLNYMSVSKLGCVAAVSSSAINSVRAEQRILYRDKILNKTFNVKAEKNDG